MARKSVPRGGCPSPDCRMGHRRQRAINPGELQEIPEADRSKIGRAETDVFVCGYCGCVYLRSNSRIIGWKDNAVFGKKWVPASQ